MKLRFPRLYPLLSVVPILFNSSSALYAQAPPSAPVEPSTPAAQSTPKKPTPSQNNQATARKPKPRKPKRPAVTRTVDTRLSGFTSEDADQIYARLSISERRDGREWYIRGSFARTATSVGSRSSRVTTYKLESRLERARNENEYNMWMAGVHVRDRCYTWRDRLDKSGYEFVSYGIGKQLGARSKGDIGLGLLQTYGTVDNTSPAVAGSIRARVPLSKKLTFDSEVLALQPTESLRSTKLDSDLGLSYELAPNFYLRLGWQATNLIRPVRTNREWDSVVRLSISFRRTTRR